MKYENSSISSYSSQLINTSEAV